MAARNEMDRQRVIHDWYCRMMLGQADTDHSILHAIIREHLEPFLREASDRDDGHGLPRFVEQEFREFLTCGVLAYGFTRLRCADCTFERLLPFSCKRRGFCCGIRLLERPASECGGYVTVTGPRRRATPAAEPFMLPALCVCGCSSDATLSCLERVRRLGHPPPQLYLRERC